MYYKYLYIVICLTICSFLPACKPQNYILHYGGEGATSYGMGMYISSWLTHGDKTYVSDTLNYINYKNSFFKKKDGIYIKYTDETGATYSQKYYPLDTNIIYRDIVSLNRIYDEKEVPPYTTTAGYGVRYIGIENIKVGTKKRSCYHFREKDKYKSEPEFALGTVAHYVVDVWIDTKTLLPATKIVYAYTDVEPDTLYLHTTLKFENYSLKIEDKE